jgi:hypothetical protein
MSANDDDDTEDDENDDVGEFLSMTASASSRQIRTISFSKSKGKVRKGPYFV